jgi:hypothetical protein
MANPAGEAQSGVGGDDRAAKLQGQAAVEIEPKCMG